MNYYAGLDVSVQETSICIVDQEGKVMKERKVESAPGPIIEFFKGCTFEINKIGLEAGPLSQWLYSGLAEEGLPVICIETRQVKAVLSAMVNKTDRNDARGISNIMRANLYKTVHVKTQQSQEWRMLLTSRYHLLNKLQDMDNHIRGELRNFGIKVGQVSKIKFEERVREILEQAPRLLRLVNSLLKVRQALWKEFTFLDLEVKRIALQDPVCSHLMTIPGVGVITSLMFRASVDVPQRFSKSRAVGAHFGLTPKRYQSGEVDYMGRISKCGDALMRSTLYEAATTLLTRVKKWSPLKAWAVRIAKHRGIHKARIARIALARKLAVVMHKMWLLGTPFCWSHKGGEITTI